MISATQTLLARSRALLAAPAAVVLALGLAASACAAGGGSGDQRAARPSEGAASARLSAAAPAHRASAAVTKLVVLVVENHSLAQMRQGMPWTFRQAQRFAYARDYHAIRHPSLPNYLAIAGGSTFGVADDAPPADHPVSGRSVFGQALTRGESAGVYADSMPRRCATSDSGRYAVRHNPWTYFVDERATCRRLDRPLSALSADVQAGSLPNAGLVVPNTCHDAHDCSLGVADRWMKHTIRTLRSGPDWAAGHLAIVLTADEDDRRSHNRVLTVVMHPSLHGKVVGDRLTHYSLTRLYDDVLGAPHLRKARRAPDMAAAFGLPLAG